MKFTNKLIISILAAAITSCSNNKNGMAPTPPQPPPANDTSGARLVSWITTGDEQKLLERQKAVPFVTGAVAANVITIDTTMTFQEMDGFGYTLTGGSAIVINQIPAREKSNLLNELFGQQADGIGISFLRISIGASDLSDSVYTYNDLPAGETDNQLNNFSLENDKGVLIPLLKEILAINSSIKILATPWTPPVWMKDNGSSIGGKLKTEFYDTYARYFVKYIQEMKKEGISIYAITPQNEPLHPGNNPSLHMSAEEQANFIKNNLGPAFQSANIDTKIIIYDHNCDRPDYPLAILNDPAAKAFVDGSAFHLYAGDIGAMSQVRTAHPDKNVYFTEQYTSIDGQFGGDLRWHLRNLIIGAPRNWSKTVLEWNLANDAAFGPHTPGGCTTCKGALTINGSAVKRNVAYYIIGHASKFVPDGSVRVNSNVPGSLLNVAYKTPDGKKVIIVLNDADTDANFSIKLGDKRGTVTLKGGAVGTYVIE